MQLYRDLDSLSTEIRSGALTIGNFDGVHLGHAKIAQQVRKRADEVGGPAVVFTFDPHPVRLLRPELAPPPLTWTRRKVELLGQLGIDAVIAYPTTPELLQLTPDEFFQQIIVQKMAAKAMVEGPNFNFGKDRAGDVQTLAALCQKNGIVLDIVEPLTRPGETEYVSSSRIRKLIAQGDVELACEMLTQPYRIRGMVTHGAGRGAHLGFATANLEAVDTLVPEMGVYAGMSYRGDEIYAAAINIGPNPTFGEKARKIEVHLIDFQGSLYGEPLEVSFLSRLREVTTFPDVEALKNQLDKDIQTTIQTFQNYQSKSSRSTA
ncbi:bifunctional riboflavin kinase/FAD synthetase [Blastopirellula marina]|uniref:Riboflavin biosynthesis protein n=1 Tax=Blastopirellula marina TaxID=124 RepID=A0A2S8F453_9BACT|nr:MULTISPECIES: bifunctional riboflavin kinase/FAD synthetase [Pirellulaceae]PQO26931.1 bifunctional riboflavin kinase/FAD synthetase [Blastopirellula marina]RCS46520.1 bifunctional riboflavin kinase/FAD synthetase [Bremerella cremea]